MERNKARYLYSELASAIQSRLGCLEPSANESQRSWAPRWTKRIRELSQLLPHGSGIDSENTVDLSLSHAKKLVIHTQFHHMNETGFYDGWTGHTITVTPSFRGINLRVSGRNRNDIKDYLCETFEYALSQEVAEHVWKNETQEDASAYLASHNIDLAYARACGGACADCGASPDDCLKAPCAHSQGDANASATEMAAQAAEGA